MVMGHTAGHDQWEEQGMPEAIALARPLSTHADHQHGMVTEQIAAHFSHACDARSHSRKKQIAGPAYPGASGVHGDTIRIQGTPKAAAEVKLSFPFAFRQCQASSF